MEGLRIAIVSYIQTLANLENWATNISIISFKFSYKAEHSSYNSKS